MPEERLPVRKIREVIRLHQEAQLSNRAIARVCNVSNSIVGEYLKRAEKVNLEWPLPEGLSDEDLYNSLFPEKRKPDKSVRPLPDWENIHWELGKRGMTLTLLWQEYREQNSDGYGDTCAIHRH